MVLGAILRGLKGTGGLTRDVGSLAGGVTSSILKPVGGLASKYPGRATFVGLGAATSMAGFGMAGVGPLSSIGEETSKYITSQYGEGLETERKISSIRALGIGAGVLGGTIGTLGAFGAGGGMLRSAGSGIATGFKGMGQGISSGFRKIPGAVKNIPGKIGSGITAMTDFGVSAGIAVSTIDLGTAAGRIGAGISSAVRSVPGVVRSAGQRIVDTNSAIRARVSGFGRGLFSNAEEAANAISRREANLRNAAAQQNFRGPGRGAAKRSATQESLRKGFQPEYASAVEFGQRVRQSISNAPGNIRSGFTQMSRFAKSDDFPIFKTSIAAGAAAGIAVGLAESDYRTFSGRGFEGNITSMSSTAGQGISPELQFSTQGLMFALHRNNKNSRSRYQ